MWRRAIAWILVSALMGWFAAQAITEVLDVHVEDTSVLAEQRRPAEVVTAVDAPAIASLALID
uniref:hypothetical protein n=1 Tax=uncultured Aeromicrobium sp. TaxID=337820 RepID=UPI0025E21790